MNVEVKPNVGINFSLLCLEVIFVIYFSRNDNVFLLLISHRFLSLP